MSAVACCIKRQNLDTKSKSQKIFTKLSARLAPRLSSDAFATCVFGNVVCGQSLDRNRRSDTVSLPNDISRESSNCSRTGTFSGIASIERKAVRVPTNACSLLSANRR